MEEEEEEWDWTGRATGRVDTGDGWRRELRWGVIAGKLANGRGLVSRVECTDAGSNAAEQPRTRHAVLLLASLFCVHTRRLTVRLKMQ